MRYGRELKARREKFNKVTLAGTVAAGAVMVGGWATGGASFIGMWFLWGKRTSGLHRWSALAPLRQHCLARARALRAVRIRFPFSAFPGPRKPLSVAWTAIR